MNRPPIVSPQEWEAAREQLLVREQADTVADFVSQVATLEAAAESLGATPAEADLLMVGSEGRSAVGRPGLRKLKRQ